MKFSIMCIILYLILFSNCLNKKSNLAQNDLDHKDAVIMPVSIVSDTTVYKMKIVPDTFSYLSDVIPVVLTNYLEKDAFYGDDIVCEYYNESLEKWEKAYTPSNLISNYTLWRIPAQDEKKISVSIFDHRPGRYRFKLTILKPRSLMVISEFVLSDVSDNI